MAAEVVYWTSKENILEFCLFFEVRACIVDPTPSKNERNKILFCSIFPFFVDHGQLEFRILGLGKTPQNNFKRDREVVGSRPSNTLGSGRTLRSQLDPSPNASRDQMMSQVNHWVFSHPKGFGVGPNFCLLFWGLKWVNMVWNELILALDEAGTCVRLHLGGP